MAVPMAEGRGGGCLGLLVLVLALLLAGCARQPPEQRLRAQLSAMQEALEQRRAGDDEACALCDGAQVVGGVLP